MTQFCQIIAEESEYGRDIKIAPTVRIQARKVKIGDKAEIHEGVEILSDTLVIDSYTSIEKENTFKVRNLKIGYKVKIEKGGRFTAINGFSEEMSFGDFSFVGFNQNILVPKFIVGDYAVIHNSLLVNGYKPCTLGHNCWIGQGTILNSTEDLIIGNNVRIGTQSQLWTHVASGELLEGCILFGAYPLIIEDNVWIVGGAVISPNLVLRNNSVIMVGAVLTKNTEAYHCYAGVPARDVTDRIKVYREVTLDDKFNMMAKFIEEFHALTERKYIDQIFLIDSVDYLPKINENYDVLVVAKKGEAQNLGPRITMFSLETKKYTKRRGELEEQFIRFNNGYRARFIPAN